MSDPDLATKYFAELHSSLGELRILVEAWEQATHDPDAQRALDLALRLANALYMAEKTYHTKPS